MKSAAVSCTAKSCSRAALSSDDNPLSANRRRLCETPRHCGPRAADTDGFETRIDEDGAPGITDGSAPSPSDEFLDAAVLAALLEPEIARGLSQPRRSSRGLRRRDMRGRELFGFGFWYCGQLPFAEPCEHCGDECADPARRGRSRRRNLVTGADPIRDGRCPANRRAIAERFAKRSFRIHLSAMLKDRVPFLLVTTTIRSDPSRLRYRRAGHRFRSEGFSS
jgi:hypothetical protein